MNLYIDGEYKRGLDTMFIVYSSLQEHPASTICEEFILSREGWVSTPLLLVEFYSVLTRNYGVDRQSVSQKIIELASKPIEILSLEGHTVATAIQLANEYNLDTNDAILLQICLTSGINTIATDD
ncbi:type II toxin-antitoxin system VapC family toxin [bacterium]|nr:type II toxin-antitoxin system VapC family toxin [bacterium]